MGIIGAEVTLDSNRNCIEMGALSSVGCKDSEIMCGQAITYAASPDAPDTCFMFADACIPDGWLSCSDLNNYSECQ